MRFYMTANIAWLVYGTRLTHCGLSYELKTECSFFGGDVLSYPYFSISLHSSCGEVTHVTATDLFPSHREKIDFELRITRSLAAVAAQKCLVLAAENRRRPLCQDQYECPTLRHMQAKIRID